MAANPRPAPKKGKGNRGFLVLLLLVFVAGLGVIWYAAFRPKEQPLAAAPTPAPASTAEPAGPLGYVMGSESAPVEIVEYGDFECPICGQFVAITEPDIRTRLVQTGLARYRYIDFPLREVHANTVWAHNAGACANAQGKFWEMHDKLYAEQADWSAFAHGKHSGNPTKTMKGYAKDLGLDTKAFDACLDAKKFDAQLMANRASGEKRGVNGTPTFFIGSHMLNYTGYDQLKAAVDSATAEAKKAAPAAKAPAKADTAKKKS